MPGFNETTICDGPLLEIYRAGKRYRKALPTLVEEAAQGRALPEDVTAFLSQPGLTLGRADTWLLDLMRDTKDPLSIYLKASSAETILRDLITPESRLAQLLPSGDTQESRETPHAQCGQILEALRSHLGIAAEFEFELEGETDERVRVEIFHAEGVESVTPKVVDGFFQSFRNRRAESKAAADSAKKPTPAPPPRPPPGEPTWADLVADEQYRKVLAILESGTMVNEAELRECLGSARQVRLFALRYEQVTEHLPFEIEIRTVAGLKTYVRKD